MSFASYWADLAWDHGGAVKRRGLLTLGAATYVGGKRSGGASSLQARKVRALAVVALASATELGRLGDGPCSARHSRPRQRPGGPPLSELGGSPPPSLAVGIALAARIGGLFHGPVGGAVGGAHLRGLQWAGV